MELSPSQIGRAVREIRLLRGLSQTQLAEETGRGVSFISKLERGERGVSPEVLEEIAAALEVPCSFLHLFADQSRHRIVKKLQGIARKSLSAKRSSSSRMAMI